MIHFPILLFPHLPDAHACTPTILHALLPFWTIRASTLPLRRKLFRSWPRKCGKNCFPLPASLTSTWSVLPSERYVLNIYIYIYISANIWKRREQEIETRECSLREQQAWRRRPSYLFITFSSSFTFGDFFSLRFNYTLFISIFFLLLPRKKKMLLRENGRLWSSGIGSFFARRALAFPFAIPFPLWYIYIYICILCEYLYMCVCMHAYVYEWMNCSIDMYVCVSL